MNTRMKNMILALVACFPMLLSIGCSKDGGGGGQTAVVATQCYMQGTSTIVACGTPGSVATTGVGQCYMQGTNQIVACGTPGSISTGGQIGGIGGIGGQGAVNCTGQTLFERETNMWGVCTPEKCHGRTLYYQTGYNQFAPVNCL